MGAVLVVRWVASAVIVIFFVLSAHLPFQREKYILLLWILSALFLPLFCVLSVLCLWLALRVQWLGFS